MSWAVGYDENHHRDIGYGVPCICDHPDCNEKIDRGLSYVCGGEPYGGDEGCGLFFCDDHLGYCLTENSFYNDTPLVPLCDRCKKKEPPYEPKPDTPEWIHHKSTDPSWEEWRQEQKRAIA